MDKLMCRRKETILADSHTYRGVACTHRCQVLAPCCGQVYPCKKCHDQEEDHQLEVQCVQSMVCMACGLRQPSGGVSLRMASCSWSTSWFGSGPWQENVALEGPCNPLIISVASDAIGSWTAWPWPSIASQAEASMLWP